MKKSTLLLLLVSSLYPLEEAVAQNKSTETHESMVSIQMENQQTHALVVLRVGQKIVYRLNPSDNFKKDKIAALTDSTISFAHHAQAIPFTGIDAIKVQRSKGRRTMGTVLIVLGPAVFLAIGFSGADVAAAAIIGAVTLPLIAGGIVLKGKRKLDIKKSWKPRRHL